MDLKQNPFAFLGEEEDTDVLILNAKASAAATAIAAKEAAVEEGEKEKKNERKIERFSTRAKRIILPRYVTKRDIVVRKEKPEGERDANGDNKGNIQQNSVAKAQSSNGDSKGINTHKPSNGHVNSNFKGNNNNSVEGSWSKNKSNGNSSNGQSHASTNGHHHGGYLGIYRRGFYGSANNGSRGQNQGFNGNNSNANNQKLEKKVEQVSNGVEKNEDEDGWTKVEKRRTRGRRSGSYDYSNDMSSQVSTVSEKDTTCEDVSNVENKASEKDTTCEDVQEASNASEKDNTREDVQEVDNASEKEIDGEVQQDINAENSNGVAEAVNGENKSNETEGQHNNAARENPRTKKNGSQKRKNKNKKNSEVAQDVSQKKEEQVIDDSQKMTLEEYEKSLLEKRKALESLKKTENSRVIQLKYFESRVYVGKNTDDGLSTNQNTKDSHIHKKDGRKEEEKVHKEVSMAELRKKCGLTFDHRGPKPCGGRRGESDKKEPFKGNGAASDQQQPAKGGHVQNTKADKLSGFKKLGHHKNIDAPLEDEAEKTPPLPPNFEDLQQFPNLGGKAA